MNISLYYFYSFIRSLVPIYPIYLLLFESKGLSLAEISLLLAIWSIPVILLELPTGILSDHWNRKNMLVIGDLLRAGCYLLWSLSDGFLLYALGFVLWGISESFSSGTIEALLFDGLKKDGLQETFDVIYGKSDFLTNVATAISMLSGGFLAMLLGLRTVLIASVASSILSAFVASQLKEVNYFREDQVHNCLKDSRPISHAYNTLRDAIQFFIGNGFIFLMAILSILGIGISGIIDEYDQLIASGYGLNLGLVGLWGGVRYFMEAAGSALAYRFKSLFIRMGMENPLSIAGALCILAGICAGVAGFSGSIWFVPFFGLFYLLLSSARILQEDILQQRIEEQGRSTVHSILSSAHNAFGVAVFSFFAAILSGLKAFDILRITSVYLLVLSLLILLAYRCVVLRKDM